MEAGQIVNSVQNIYRLCNDLAKEKGKKLPPISIENQKDAGEDQQFVKDLITMLETGSDYLEDLVSVLKDLNKEYKWEDIDKDNIYEKSAKTGGRPDYGLYQNKTSTPAASKKPDAAMGSSGVGGSRVGK